MMDRTNFWDDGSWLLVTGVGWYHGPIVPGT